jgi:hypothetical protein
MWFCFGFITLICFSVYFQRLGSAASWRGGFKPFGVLDYEVEYVTNKDSSKYLRFLIGVRVPAHYSFTLKREDWIDRFWKWIGLSVEHQVGRDDFDKLIYVASNDEPFLKQMTADAGLLSLLVRVFSAKRYGCYVKEVHCHQGRLWAVVKIGSLFNTKTDYPYHDKVERELAQVLEQAGQRLRDAQPLTPPQGRDIFRLRVVAIVSTSLALVFNALLHCFRLSLDRVTTLDLSQLWLYAGIAALGVLGVFLALTVCLLGRSAQAHLTMSKLMLLVSVGALLTGLCAVRDFNIEMDGQAAEVVLLKVVKKKSRKGDSLLETTRVDNNEAIRSISVSHGFYDNTQIGDTVSIDVHPGYLGIPWFDTIRRVPKP